MATSELREAVAAGVWFVGMVTLLMRAQARPRTPGIATRIDTHHLQVGKGRRSRFQNSQVPPIYCAAGSREYQAVIATILDSSDVVLEIGCQLNSLTRLMSERASAVVGVDLDRKAPTTSELRSNGFYRKHSDPAELGLSNVAFHLMDTWDLQILLEAVRAGPHAAVSIVVVDMTVVLGNDLVLEVLALLRALHRLLSPRALVVKSRALAGLQHRLRPAPAACPLSADLQRRVLLIAADLVHDYRCAALSRLHLLKPGESALEIGCHVGASTALLDQAIAARGGGRCVGVDVSDAIIGRARALHPNVLFEVADAWDAASLVSSLERCGVGPPSLLLLDVGGLSGSSGTLDALALMRVLCALFHSSLRVLVIKSSCMRTLAMQLRPTREVVPPDAKQRQFGCSDH